ncbi:RagB/SusD family nutrient uptake outer membrane protein [uncultured Duncaniella sp.]|uniref:RagB/SusD family nutrient uptake outer membrane protein n=1 Tax=uncultured Duncaniella sp. TaxID=2768039 RepID=UPI002676C6F4|nr:RagB/SusD family nutrient uptake outer membrane protein [uncultured Duncaniella sp.]MCI9172067.1 RagB/SusD family nutrient uptake outer membrane protein [Muribaculaceae bacterium]
MKTFNKSIKYLASAAIMAVGLTSCSDFLTEQSQDLAKVESWRDLDEVLLGDGYMHSGRLYTANSASYVELNSGLDVLHFMTDEIELNTSASNDYVNYVDEMFPFFTWQQDTGVDKELRYTGGDATYWNDLYSRINVCNMVIALIDEQPETDIDDATQKERVKGEAHFLRGMCYFFLANLYAQPYTSGDASTAPGVPIKTTEFIEDTEFVRATLEETYAQILSDFHDASTFLAGKTVKSKYHGNESAANMMLSRVYLYMQDWDNAVAYADKVLASNSKLLDLHTVSAGSNSVYFTSPETLFTMGHYLIAANFADDRYGDDPPAFKVSDCMQDLFDRNDLRSTLYIGDTEDGYYSNVFLKYNQQRSKWGGMTDVSSYCLLRTPEAYLNKAEALAYKGQDAQACEVLASFLRYRMNSVSDINMSGNALIDFIREERAREFLLEGHRWFDLRRYTVCEKYPWSKVIDHSYNYYHQVGWRTVVDYIDTYRLEEYDQAYTLPIPRAIREFQPSIGNNPRPARKANRVSASE